MRRRNFAITSHLEERLLNYVVQYIPAFITPDILTMLALVSAILGGLFYILSGSNFEYLHLVNFCIAFHWLADSLDGRIARVRKIQRPNYGYYIDHILDTSSAAFLIGGLTVSSLTLTSSWMWVLTILLMLMIHVFLKTKAFGVFELSIGSVGPTEARIGLTIVNLIILFSNNPMFIVFKTPATVFDILGALIAVFLSTILIKEMYMTAYVLNQKDVEQIQISK